MRICLILEGSYPYVRGGVSSWAHDLIRGMPQHEFVLWTVAPSVESRGAYVYELPDNVVAVQETFLDEALMLRAGRNSSTRLTAQEREQMRALFQARDPDWNVLFHCYNNRKINPVAFLMSEEYLELLKQMGWERYPFVSFSSLFYTVRSMFLPLLYLMGTPIPEADVYHATAAGYGSVLGSMGAWKYGRPFVLTEHGLYTREREEEILRSNWVVPSFRELWISLFHLLSRCAYQRALTVTSLFEQARNTQVELGCPPEKCQIIRNGVRSSRFDHVGLKQPDGYIDIGAIVRVVPIKDIKTMIYAFSSLKHRFKKVRLHILGDLSDEGYFRECRELVRQLGVADVLFVGETNVVEYMPKLDFTVLTSISEGQPLAVIESMAACRPCVVTNVGSCRELVEGNWDDDLGTAGLCVPPMHRQMLTDAMLSLCLDDRERLRMGEAGRQRVRRYYEHDFMIRNYDELYKGVLQWQG